MMMLDQDMGRPRRRDAPIREAIIAYLSEPRSAGEVADHIGRPIPTATGHLNAARKLGLIKRVARSRYALATFERSLEPALGVCARPQAKTRLRRRIIELLHNTRTENDLHLLTEASRAEIKGELHRLRRHAFLQGDAVTGLRLRDHALRRFSHSIRNSVS